MTLSQAGNKHWHKDTGQSVTLLQLQAGNKHWHKDTGQSVTLLEAGNKCKHKDAGQSVALEGGSFRQSSLRGPSSIRWTWELFQRQRWGNCWEMGWSTYRLFQLHSYHSELNWTKIRYIAAPAPNAQCTFIASCQRFIVNVISSTRGGILQMIPNLRENKKENLWQEQRTDRRVPARYSMILSPAQSLQ